MSVDWDKLKTEYVRGGMSYRDIAEKYGLAYGTVRKRAAKGKWTALREQKVKKRDTMVIESRARAEAKLANRMNEAVDMLMEQIVEGVRNRTFSADTQSIRQLVAALKDLKDLKGIRNELDVQEQMARIEKLRRDAAREDENKDIRVVISDGLSEYSK